MTQLLGVVLAGGQSSRMGRDKASLRHRSGTTFLQYALNLLRPLCAEVAVSVAHQRCDAALAGRELADVTVLEDPVVGLGPAIGVATAVQAAAQRSLSAALVIPVDMPALTAMQLMPLIDVHRDHPHDLVAATLGQDRRYEPLLAIYPVRFAAALQQLAASQHRSLNRWLSGQQVRQVVLVDAAAANLNTPVQLADYQRHHKSTN